MVKMPKLVKGLVIAGSIAIISSLGGSARAANEHFVGDLSARCSGADLRVFFKVAGLGEGEFITISASGSAVKQCVNKGDNLPPGQDEPVGGTGTFGPASKNGSISNSILLDAQGDCPGNQRLRVTYEDVSLDLDGGADFATLDGTFVCTE